MLTNTNTEMLCHDCMKTEGREYLQKSVPRVTCEDCMEKAIERNASVHSIALLSEQIALGKVTKIYGKWFLKTEASIKMGPNSFDLLNAEVLKPINARVENGKLAIDLYFQKDRYGLFVNHGVLHEKIVNGQVLQQRTVIMDSIIYISTEQNRYLWDK